MAWPSPDLVTFWNLLEWSFAAGIVGLFAMFLDKAIATSQWTDSRMSESTLFAISFLGGFWGIILGGCAVRHKTSKIEFWICVGLATALWAALLSFMSA